VALWLTSHNFASPAAGQQPAILPETTDYKLFVLKETPLA
jgi:hypothetical protein